MCSDGRHLSVCWSVLAFSHILFIFITYFFALSLSASFILFLLLFSFPKLSNLFPFAVRKTLDMEITKGVYDVTYLEQHNKIHVAKQTKKMENARE